MKDWIMDNIKLFYLLHMSWQKHEQHCLIKIPFKIVNLLSFRVLLHDIHIVMDMYASLEYKHHKGIETSIKF
jgi:hypothetical protein